MKNTGLKIAVGILSLFVVLGGVGATAYMTNGFNDWSFEEEPTKQVVQKELIATFNFSDLDEEGLTVTNTLSVSGATYYESNIENMYLYFSSANVVDNKISYPSTILSGPQGAVVYVTEYDEEENPSTYKKPDTDVSESVTNMSYSDDVTIYFTESIIITI